jgi:hypothetical protein
MLRSELTIIGNWGDDGTFCWEQDPSTISIEDRQTVDAFCSAHNLRQVTLVAQSIPSDLSHQTVHP